MRTTASLDAPCLPEVLFAHVASLDRYPAWMALVHRVEPPHDEVDAWDVELRARVGPLARSKRLRMVRARFDEPRIVVFERQELDGRHHAEWRLTAQVEPVGAAASRLTMELVYGGALWTGGVLQRILDEEIRRGSERLLELVSASPTR